MAFPRRAWLLPVVAAMLALLVTVPTIWSKPDTLYPVQVDSAEYDRVGRGLARLIHDLPSVVPKIVGGHFTDADRTRYEMNGWILQHAASYLTLLGGTYAASGGSEAAGRLLTALLFAGASALVVGWTRRRFGVVPALILLQLF
ncbi:MAG: hypothetical protein KC729_13385, partial [Candidatus Eisenbacteria bacterium]|nr:hypothetical protein [Candidatus Eisenbacteria bacterium]